MSEQSRDAEFWAKPVDELRLGHEVPGEAINLNVDGKRLAGMNTGFGKMWQKTYRVEVGPAVTPAQVVAEWKQHFGSFWPKAGRYFGPLTSISPGDVALLNLKLGGPAKLSTGVFVLYADDVSFSFLTPEGHIFAGMITFSAHERAGSTVAQVQALIRASDPLYEAMMPVAVHRREDAFWKGTLSNLAAHLGAEASRPELERVCVDRKRQWAQWRNIRNNAAIRTLLHSLGAPVRALRRRPTDA